MKEKKESGIRKTRRTIYVTNKIYDNAKSLGLNISEICENAIRKELIRGLNQNSIKKRWKVKAKIFYNKPAKEVKIDEMTLYNPEGKKVFDMADGNLFYDIDGDEYEKFMTKDIHMIKGAIIDCIRMGNDYAGEESSFSVERKNDLDKVSKYDKKIGFPISTNDIDFDITF